MKRILSITGALTVLSASVMAAAMAPAHAQGVSSHTHAKKFTVGVVLDVGGVNDKSFNHLAYVGLQMARVKYKVDARYIVSNAQSDYVPNLTNFAQHADLTIGVGFLMQSAMYQVAKQYPNKKFAMVDGAPQDASGKTVNLPNVANLFFREQESGYLVGVIAGLMEKSHIGRARHNTIGYMGGLSIPPVNRYIAGYIQGARKVDPSIRVLPGYSQSFTDQAKGRQIGIQQINLGADILFQVAGSSGLGYLNAAQSRGLYGIGVDANQGYLGRYIITSALKKVDVAVMLTVRDTLKGHFRGGDHQFSLSNNATGFAKTSGVVPASIVAQAKMYQKLIAAHKIVPTTVIH